MSVVLLVVGLLATAVGFFAIGFGIAPSALNFGNTLITAGSSAAAAGLIPRTDGVQTRIQGGGRYTAAPGNVFGRCAAGGRAAAHARAPHARAAAAYA